MDGCAQQTQLSCGRGVGRLFGQIVQIGIRSFDKKCDFVIYMNWAPCGECANRLIGVFDNCDEGTVLFTALYTSWNQDVSYKNYKGWTKLKETVTFGFMRRPDYRCLKIRPPFNVKGNNKRHSAYAVDKMPYLHRASVRSFCDTLV